MHYRRISYRYSVHRVGVPQFGDPRSEPLPFALAEPVWRPPADVYESPDEYVVKVEVPGLAEEDFQITLYADVLVIEGNRSSPLPGGQARVLAMELRYGPFRLEVPLPASVGREGIAAHYDLGFLYVKLPKGGGPA